MRRLGYAFLMSSIVAVSFGCRSPVDADEPFRASIVRDSLRLTNDTRRPVYFFLLEAARAPVTNWAVCTDPAQCVAVGPGESRMIGRDQARIGTDSTTVIVYWWHLVPSREGYQSDTIRATGAHWPAQAQ